MAVYIQLLSRETGEPVTFTEIDERMCKDFGVEVHPTKYFRYWYDMICFPLALGQTYGEIRERWKGFLEDEDEVMVGHTKLDLEVLDWLEDRYEPRAWGGR
jgi:hypothetical protein